MRQRLRFRFGLGLALGLGLSLTVTGFLLLRPATCLYANELNEQCRSASAEASATFLPTTSRRRSSSASRNTSESLSVT